MTPATQTSIPTQSESDATPYAIWNPAGGVWETLHPDHLAYLAPHSAIWSICEWMHHARASRHGSRGPQFV